MTDYQALVVASVVSECARHPEFGRQVISAVGEGLSLFQELNNGENGRLRFMLSQVLQTTANTQFGAVSRTDIMDVLTMHAKPVSSGR